MVTEQQLADAAIKTGNQAIDFLEAIATFGDRLKVSLREPVDVNAQFQEMRIETEDFATLMSLFSEVRKWLDGIKTCDGSLQELATKFNEWERDNTGRDEAIAE